MPKTRKSIRRTESRDVARRPRICEDAKWDNASDFRAVVLAMGHWRLPAEVFFNPRNGSLMSISQICDRIPEREFLIEEKRLDGKNRGSRVVSGRVGDDDSYHRMIKRDIDGMYEAWEDEVEQSYLDRKKMADSIVTAIEEDIYRGRVPVADRAAYVRTLFFKKDPYINALAMLDPYGRPLSVRGIVRASLAFN